MFVGSSRRKKSFIHCCVFVETAARTARTARTDGPDSRAGRTAGLNHLSGRKRREQICGESEAKKQTDRQKNPPRSCPLFVHQMKSDLAKNAS